MNNSEEQPTPSSSTNAAPLARGLGMAQRTPRDTKPTRPRTTTPPPSPNPASSTRVTAPGNRTNSDDNNSSTRTQAGPRR